MLTANLRPLPARHSIAPVLAGKRSPCSDPPQTRQLSLPNPYICMYVLLYVSTYARIYLCMFIFVCMYVCMYVYIHIAIIAFIITRTTSTIPSRHYEWYDLTYIAEVSPVRE